MLRPILIACAFLLGPLPITASPMGTYVGELQERWEFPSDHLPIGVSYDTVHILSWNVLDSGYMSWVTEKNSQGLSRSQIVDLHVYIENSNLTLRDRYIVHLLLQSLKHPTHPRSLLLLQECNRAFSMELAAQLPANWDLIEHDGNALLIDRARFDVLLARPVIGVFSTSPKRSFQEVWLKQLDTDKTFRVFNAHLPGGPEGPARYEFAQFLANVFDSNVVTIAAGDMNFNECEMDEALSQAFSNTPYRYVVYSPYCTNVGPDTFYSKAIDHFVFFNGETCIPNRPEEVFEGVEPIVNLLQGS